jgi:hypothetical protein
VWGCLCEKRYTEGKWSASRGNGHMSRRSGGHSGDCCGGRNIARQRPNRVPYSLTGAEGGKRTIFSFRRCMAFKVPSVMLVLIFVICSTSSRHCTDAC